jgi:predicted Zn-dependent peptidase
MIEGDVPTLDDLVARIRAVTPDDINRVIDRIFRDQPRTLAVVGPHDQSDFL